MVQFRPNSPMAKKYGKNESKLEVPDGLSKAEEEAYRLANGSTGSEKLKTEDTKEQTVSKVKYNKDIAELKDKLRKKEEKINELNKDREELRKERDAAKARWERARADLELEQKKTGSLRTELNNANNQIDSLKKENKRLTSHTASDKVPDTKSELESKLKKSEKDLKELTGKYEVLQGDLAKSKAEKEANEVTIGHLNETILGFDAERARFEDILALKDNEIETLKNCPELTQEQSSKGIAGTLIRKSPIEIYSDMLDDGNYDVKLARNGSYMLIIPNVEGTAICKDHSIILPRLEELVPFTKEMSFKLIPAGNNVLRVEMKLT